VGARHRRQMLPHDLEPCCATLRHRSQNEMSASAGENAFGDGRLCPTSHAAKLTLRMFIPAPARNDRQVALLALDSPRTGWEAARAHERNLRHPDCAARTVLRGAAAGVDRGLRADRRAES